MKFDLITIGDASEDVFIRPAEMEVKNTRSLVTGRMISFELGEKIPIEDVNYDIGGSSANVAVGLSRMGLKTSVVTAVGKDSPAEKILERFVNEGVDTANINVKETNKTNFAVILNTEDGERTILVYHGISYEDLIIKKSLSPKWFFLTPVGEKSDKLFSQVLAGISERGIKFAWNPGSRQIKQGATHFRSLLKNTAVLFMNREEAIKFLDYPVRPKIEDVMKRLHNLGVGIVVVTNGREGAYAYDGQVYYHTDIIKEAKRVDATGAGDSFATGFLGKLISEKYDGSFNKELISEALKYGIINSTSVVMYVGAQKGLLSAKEIEEGITKHPRLTVDIYFR